MLGSGNEAVADAVDCLYITRIGGVVLDFLPQLGDVLVQGAGRPLVPDSPDFIQEREPLDHLAVMVEKKAEEPNDKKGYYS